MQRAVKMSPLCIYYALEWPKSNKGKQLTVEVNTAAFSCIAIRNKWGNAKNPFIVNSLEEG